MSRIAATLAALKAQGRKALIPYIAAGDPFPEATVEIMLALAEGGDSRAIRFTAPDPRNALTILEQHPQQERATVWEGSQKVCCITRSGGVLAAGPDGFRQGRDGLSGAGGAGGRSGTQHLTAGSRDRGAGAALDRRSRHQRTSRTGAGAAGPRSAGRRQHRPADCPDPGQRRICRDLPRQRPA